MLPYVREEIIYSSKKKLFKKFVDITSFVFNSLITNVPII